MKISGKELNKIIKEEITKVLEKSKDTVIVHKKLLTHQESVKFGAPW